MHISGSMYLCQEEHLCHHHQHILLLSCYPVLCLWEIVGYGTGDGMNGTAEHHLWVVTNPIQNRIKLKSYTVCSLRSIQGVNHRHPLSSTAPPQKHLPPQNLVAMRPTDRVRCAWSQHFLSISFIQASSSLLKCHKKSVVIPLTYTMIADSRRRVNAQRWLRSAVNTPVYT